MTEVLFIKNADDDGVVQTASGSFFIREGETAVVDFEIASSKIQIHFKIIRGESGNRFYFNDEKNHCFELDNGGAGVSMFDVVKTTRKPFGALSLHWKDVVNGQEMIKIVDWYIREEIISVDVECDVPSTGSNDPDV